MSTLIEKLGDRREPRYSAYGEDSLVCSVSVIAEGSEKTFSATVINLSQSGARLKVPEIVNVGQWIHVRFAAVGTEVKISVDAKIRWTQPAADGHMAFGCVLAESIDSETLEDLAEVGILERRQDERISVSIPVSTRQELSDSESPAELEEYSRGGVRLKSDEIIDLDGRLMITFPEINKTIIVRPVWQRQINGQNRVGCRLLERSDSAIISTLVQGPKAAVATKSSQKPWVWCGLGVVITWFILKLLRLA